MSDGGKGSKSRPFSVTQDEFVSNWDRIFGKKNEEATTETSKVDQSPESGEVALQRLQPDT